ncbi:MAG: glycosyltransferase [Candidatus Paceibacterota bacterium]
MSEYEKKLDQSNKKREDFQAKAKKILIVGPSNHFTSGISYYTAALANALSEKNDVECILIKNLAPKIIYPGSDRVGSNQIEDLGYRDNVKSSEHLHWYWGLDIFKALKTVSKNSADALLLQWWTGTALHTYLLLAAYAKLHRTPVILEFHETIDVSEARVPFVKQYIKLGMRALLKLTDHGVVHSKEDVKRVKSEFAVKDTPLTVIKHGPYRANPNDGEVSANSYSVVKQISTAKNITKQNENGRYAATQNKTTQNETAQNVTEHNVTEQNKTAQNKTVQNETAHNKTADNVTTNASSPVERKVEKKVEKEVEKEVVKILFFGVIRKYKGLAVLAKALEILNQEDQVQYKLSVYGEPWEDAKDDIRLVNNLPSGQVNLNLRYLSNQEISQAFKDHDLLALPYLRSSASGPLHMALGEGKVVVTSRIPSLTEAVEGYSGALLAEPGDPESLAEQIKNARTLISKEHVDPYSWFTVAENFNLIIEKVQINKQTNKIKESTNSKVYSQKEEVGSGTKGNFHASNNESKKNMLTQLKEEKHKLFILSPRFKPYPGGVEVHTEKIAHSLADLNVDVTVLTVAKNNFPNHEKKYKVIRFKPYLKDILLTSPTIKIVKTIARSQPDTLHLQQYHQLLPALTLLLLKILSPSTRVVTTPHYHGVGKNNFRTLLHFFYRRTLGKALIKYSDKIIAVSEPEAKLLVKHFPFIVNKVVVIPNGVTEISKEMASNGNKKIVKHTSSESRDYLLRYFEKHAGSIRKEATLMVSGRLERYKRVDLAIEMVKNSSYKLLITGDGPDLPRLRSLTKGYEHMIAFTGQVSEDELLSLRESSALTLAPSTQEAYGMSVAEARSVGHRVVASDIPAHRFIADMTDGITLLKTDRPEEWLNAVKKSLATPLGSSNLPSWRQVANQLLKVYKEI